MKTILKCHLGIFIILGGFFFSTDSKATEFLDNPYSSNCGRFQPITSIPPDPTCEYEFWGRQPIEKTIQEACTASIARTAAHTTRYQTSCGFHNSGTCFLHAEYVGYTILTAPASCGSEPGTCGKCIARVTELVDDVKEPFEQVFDDVSLGWGTCALGQRYLSGTDISDFTCGRPIEIDLLNKKSCQPKYGNPILPLKGEKRQTIELEMALDGLPLKLNYSTARRFYHSIYGPTTAGRRFFKDITGEFGTFWWLNINRALYSNTQSSYSSDGVQASVGGQTVSFSHYSGLTGDRYSPDSNDELIWKSPYQLHVDRTAGAVAQHYFDRTSDLGGRVRSVHYAEGAVLTYAYSDTSTPPEIAPLPNLLIRIEDRFGRNVQFTYAIVADTPVVVSMLHSSGAKVEFRHDDQARLRQVVKANQKVLKLEYDSPNLNQEWALTKIIDEEGKQSADFAYDPQGNATYTKSVLGEYSVSYSVPPKVKLTEEYKDNRFWRIYELEAPVGASVKGGNGGTDNLQAASIFGFPESMGGSQSSGSGCDAGSSKLERDARGNVTLRLNADGRFSCSAFESARNFESVRVEGFLKTPNAEPTCPPDLAAYKVPPDLPSDRPQRKSFMKWHSTWHLETRHAEPKRITTTVYNGQPDPIIGDGAEVICAPNAPTLPNDSKAAVICTRYEQSTDDETGNLGFDAPVKETDTRKWSYMYNQYGQVVQQTDPRGKLTTYEYWDKTEFSGDGNAARGHWLGDLKMVENALHQKTEYLEYNKRGQVLTTRFPNGAQEQREYHARGWLTKVTQVPADGGTGEITQYDYYATGLLNRVTQPDGSFAIYTWDNTHRLTDVVDSADNSVHYVLDAAGNRESETYKDPQGKLARAITRTFDALGRMDSSKEGSQ